ncbi:murein DD-endopeptidase MepM/ murein hydrolase activator NlpD [Desulfitispora alkaliphila]|uniref:murein hydrolase activator EnvC family protein n=1 Tax=Desulfitispora alkaliphila TaxID=622674 RepID=UPI003D19EBBE
MLKVIKRFRWIIAFFVGVAVIATVLLPVSANELERLQREQRQLQQDIDRQQQELTQNRQQQQRTANDIYRLEQEIEKTRQEIASLAGELEETEAKVELTQLELEEAELRLDERTDALSARVKEIFINGQVNYLEILLQSSNINDFLTRFALLERLMEQDMALMEEIEAERQLIAAKKLELEEQHARIAKIKLETEKKEQQMVAQNRERQNWLASLKTNAATMEEALDDLERTSKQVESTIRQLQLSSRGDGITGIANWPTPGYTRVTSDYGPRIHPITGTRRTHTGIDIGAPTGVNIVAVDYGTVIYSDWLGGYGKTIMIDHGNNISSLYAHQSSLLVRVGDTVDRGQVIGKVGSTGQSTGPHLHFEIRRNGVHTNPWPYLR